MGRRFANTIVAAIVVVALLAGGLLGGTIVATQVADNTNAIDELEEVSARQQAGAQRGMEIQDLLQCLLLQFTLPVGERPVQLTPEVCPDVDFDELESVTRGSD
jgi:hypothetical protein